LSSRPGAAYAVDQFRDPAAELERLQRQAAIFAATEEAALSLLGLPDSGKALDVGCGPGYVAARIHNARPALEITGVDRDPALVERARALMPALEAHADRLPFPAQHFDAAYARLVLRHVDRPEAALAEMFRVLKPGGRAIAIDSDDGALLLHPNPPAFARALAAREQTFQRRNADPFIGRRLPSLFREAGFVDLSVRPLVVDSVTVGLRPFAHIVLSPVADAIDLDLLDAEGTAAALRAIESWSNDAASFGIITLVALGGTHP
jgi:ubiquinone/menaquinone biosynthesis C-methylase UbiE